MIKLLRGYFKNMWERRLFNVGRENISESVRIHAICYNEERILPFFINHYKNHFPLCVVVIYDNYSTDNSVKIAKDLGCEVQSVDTKGEINDSIWQKMKNTCWQGQKEKWAIVVDCDELIEADFQSLLSNQPFNIHKFQGIQMVGEGQPYDKINFGVPDSVYSKSVLFNTLQIAEMNYSVGAHTANPTPKKGYKIVYCKDSALRLFHYKWVDFDIVISKHRHYAKRLSVENKVNSWGWHYTEEEVKQKEYYKSLLKNKILVR